MERDNLIEQAQALNAAVAVIKEYCESRTADDACRKCLFRDNCGGGAVHMGGCRAMTQERERILQKIKRVQALAERGVAGEQESAAATLERLMKQYGITEADIAEERREWEWFRYKTPIERKLLLQVIYAVTGRVGSERVGAYTGRKRKQVWIECTAAERLEIQFDYDFFREALEEEMNRFFSAFLIKNGIFPPEGKERDELPPPREISREEALKLEALMMGMNHHTRRAALESGVEP